MRLIYGDENQIEKIREDFSNFGCKSEVLLQGRVIAVNVPKGIEYGLIKKYLENGENQGDWQYEESCLAHEY